MVLLCPTVAAILDFQSTQKIKKKIVRDHPMTTGIHIQFGYKVIAIPHMALWVWYAKMFS